jgi:hypothetical protein
MASDDGEDSSSSIGAEGRNSVHVNEPSWDVFLVVKRVKAKRDKNSPCWGLR